MSRHSFSAGQPCQWSPGPIRGAKIGDANEFQQRSPAAVLSYFANNWLMSLNALNSSALPQGSRKNIVACSPT